MTLHGQNPGIIAENATVEKAGTGYAFTEGPAVDTEGRVFFTDQPNDRIHVWDEGKGISLWLEGTGRSNGMYFDNDGQLLACVDEHNRVVRFDDRKEMRALLENYKGKHLNGPNDLWVSPTGDIYFTDPYYHRDYWEVGHAEAQDARSRSRDGKVSASTSSPMACLYRHAERHSTWPISMIEKYGSTPYNPMAR